MSTQVRVTQVQQAYEKFHKPEFLQFLDTVSFNDFDGPNINEVREQWRFSDDTLGRIIKQDALKLLSWNALNQLQGILTNINNFVPALLSEKSQQSFQNCATQIDQLSHHIRMFGLPLVAVGGDELQKNQKTILEELERLKNNNIAVDSLRKEIRNLLDPAVAGTLSRAFMKRRDNLFIGRLVWGLIAGCLMFFGIVKIFDIVTLISTELSIKSSEAVASHQMFPIILVRTIIIVALYIAFGFAFSQYKKERDLEEEYAHRAALAISLPNFGDLAREPTVRDQIVTGATSAIFKSPSSHGSNTDDFDLSLGHLSKIVDSVAKLIPKP